MVANLTGKPTKGGDFFDRQDVTARIWSRLKDGNNILLLAPRRVGKTSLMYHLVDHAKANGFQPLMVSVAGARTESEFLRHLVDGLHDLNQPDARKMLENLARRARWLKQIKKLSFFGVGWEVGELGDNWKEAGEDLRRGLCDLPGRWLLLIDELPIFVQRMLEDGQPTSRAAVFLDWMRDLRVAPNAPTQVQWLLSGSIGLDNVTRQARLGDKINDLHNETGLGEFTPQTAADFLTALGVQYRISLDARGINDLCARAGWLIPFHLQLLFSELRDVVPSQTTPTPEQIHAAYENLLSPQKRSAFSFWIERLERHLPEPTATHALMLVDVVAAGAPAAVSRPILNQNLTRQINDPVERQQQLDFLLQLLQTDGYLVHDGTGYRFRSALLCDFWKRSRLQ